MSDTRVPTGKNYNGERNVLILISLMKAHGVRKIVASPGTTNISFVASVQNDSWFQVYSAADERSAAYMACGLSVESGEPVALSCTGATASRNYVSGLTEAFYRQIPILAITSTQKLGRVGQYVPQVIDRSMQMKDLVKLSVQCTMVHNEEEARSTAILLNNAILELRKDGGGPVHINLETEYSNDFSVKDLPNTKVIRRYCIGEELPMIQEKRVAIFVGAHIPFSDELLEEVDRFCEKYNGVVLVDHTSGYRGKYHVMCNLASCQGKVYPELLRMKLMIHIGQVSGAYPRLMPTSVWRVHPDGVVRATFNTLDAVFQMDELTFFRTYNEMGPKLVETSFFDSWYKKTQQLSSMIDEKALPFSNIWVARELSPKLPSGAVLHLGILNSLRSWNFFDVDYSVRGYSNTGGFGIDGCLSSLIGASLANPDKLYFGVIGDLAFFYDMNALGNHNVGRNLRILLVNNGVGTEFKNYNHRAAQFGDAADEFMAARGHYGNKSPDLVKHYAEDLGLRYFCASDKEGFRAGMDEFLNPEIGDRSILFEIFTNSEDESSALKHIHTLEKDASAGMVGIAKSILGEKGVAFVKSHIL